MSRFSEAVDQEIAETEGRLNVLRGIRAQWGAQGRTETASPAKPTKARRAAKATAPKAATKRGSDSELTKARKRVASAKRFGKVPSVEDQALVQSSETQAAE